MKTINSILFILTAIALFSCEKDNDIVPPEVQVEFKIDYPLIGVNWDVKLTNLSDRSNITLFEWDFGDGSEPKIMSSTNSNIPQHYYSKAGEYEIKLTGIQEDGTRKSYKQTLRVGEAYLDQVEINQISEYKNDDPTQKWDIEKENENSFPELQLFIEVDNKTAYESQVYSNLSWKNFPLTIKVPSVKLYFQESGVPSWGSQQQFYLYDVDLDAEELMIAPKICSILVQRSLEEDYDLGKGSVLVESGDYLFHFYYFLK
ncbi:PKD domain-containing protein [Marinifilum fragile]|uniref:PKD domain-containing protein n=1 Tax=Marinifilum fragile TaxID=570161 RepID=UPI002AAC2F56|nr:PKD domain-containing protein [Marinifilum fragile]